MKPNQIMSALLVFAFTATSVPSFGDSPRQHEIDALGQSLLAPKSRLAQDGQIEALSGPDEALYNKICGDINRIADQVISLKKDWKDWKDLTKVITGAVSSMTPDQFGRIAPHLVNFLMEKYGRYKDSSYDSDERRIWLGIVAGFGKIGETAAESKLKPVVSLIVEILGSALISIDGTGWFHEASVEALGEIGETLMLSEVEGCEDIAKRITAVLRGYINEGRGFAYVEIAEIAIKGLGKIGIQEDETVSMLRVFAKEYGSVFQGPAKVALRQIGASEVDPAEADVISGLIKQFRQSPDPESKAGIIDRLRRIGPHAVRALQDATRRDPAAQVMIENVIRPASRRGGFEAGRITGMAP